MVGVVGSSPIAPTNFLRVSCWTLTNDPSGRGCAAHPWAASLRLRSGTALRASKFAPDEFVESNRAYKTLSEFPARTLTNGCDVDCEGLLRLTGRLPPC